MTTHQEDTMTDAQASDVDAIATEVEARLDAEVHERLCACPRFPNECVTYGSTIPWSHSDVHHITEVTLAVIAGRPA